MELLEQVQEMGWERWGVCGGWGGGWEQQQHNTKRLPMLSLELGSGAHTHAGTRAVHTPAYRCAHAPTLEVPSHAGPQRRGVPMVPRYLPQTTRQIQHGLEASRNGVCVRGGGGTGDSTIHSDPFLKAPPSPHTHPFACPPSLPLHVVPGTLPFLEVTLWATPPHRLHSPLPSETWSPRTVPRHAPCPCSTLRRWPRCAWMPLALRHTRWEIKRH
jgi:hypothetical protein